MNTIDQEWYFNLKDVLHFGQRISPRGKNTLELVAETSKIDMNYPILVNPIRAINYKFMAAECYWILSGDNRVDGIAPYMQIIKNFSDDGETFFGAYGPKVIGQLKYVIEKLNKDPDTRQATLSIWRENPPETKDYPCTIAMTFFIRNDAIHCHTTMRSNDLWLGRPYDVFNFSMITNAVRLWLDKKYKLGSLHLTATSMHVYENNFEAAHEVLEMPLAKSPKIKEFDSFTHLMASLDIVRQTGDIQCLIG